MIYAHSFLIYKDAQWTDVPNSTNLVRWANPICELQDAKDKSQSISVTAFQSVAANEGLSPSPSFMAGRLPSMDADMAQAIQLSLSGPHTVCPLILSTALPYFACQVATNASHQNQHDSCIMVQAIELFLSGLCAMWTVTAIVKGDLLWSFLRPAHTTSTIDQGPVSCRSHCSSLVMQLPQRL